MGRAILSGLIATAIVSALVYANRATGFLPQFDLLTEIEALNLRFGLPEGVRAAWITHGVAGVGLFALAFAVLRPVLPGGAAGQGLVFGLALAVVMLGSLLPLTGHAFLAQDMDGVFIGAAVAANVLYGLLLSVSFDALAPEEI